MKRYTLAGTAILFILLGLYFLYGPRFASEKTVTKSAPDFFTEQLYASSIGNGSILPLPPVPQLPPEKVALGNKLFNDTRLSHDNSISCASCHNLSKGGTDRMRYSVGINNTIGNINSPTVFNAALNIAQFWDGRANTLEEQAAAPIHNPAEMGSNWEEVIAKIGTDSTYKQAFNLAYTDGITPTNIADAIAMFERTLITTNSRFDRYLNGETDALSEIEIEGYHRFIEHGCSSCHQGAGVGGNMFQRFGVMDDFFKGRPPSKVDLGRFNVTGNEEDKHVFKVPSLRNIAVTAPYFHDGSAPTLKNAIAIMGRYQLGKNLSTEDVDSIDAFLRTLTGEWQGKVVE